MSEVKCPNPDCVNGQVEASSPRSTYEFDCPTCKGKGTVPEEAVREKCLICEGTGKIRYGSCDPHDCTYCDGMGKRREVISNEQPREEAYNLLVRCKGVIDACLEDNDPISEWSELSDDIDEFLTKRDEAQLPREEEKSLGQIAYGNMQPPWHALEPYQQIEWEVVGKRVAEALRRYREKDAELLKRCRVYVHPVLSPEAHQLFEDMDKAIGT